MQIYIYIMLFFNNIFNILIMYIFIIVLKLSSFILEIFFLEKSKDMKQERFIPDFKWSNTIIYIKINLSYLTKITKNLYKF